ncbi:hypothetical protein bcgnr5376_48610 [Bacillus cereus]
MNRIQFNFQQDSTPHELTLYLLLYSIYMWNFIYNKINFCENDFI